MAHRFGDLEAVVMDRVWSAPGPITVRTVFEDLLRTREIAYTTVMTTMDNLHRKGWLERERDGKAYRYHPRLTREQYSAQLMREALGGGRSDLVLAHFVEQISDDDTAALRKVLRRMRAKNTADRPGAAE
ncbi:BlaI/MecI/CopY family transcriptional regulator [Nocardia nova]|uniref:Transcriptional regulator n=1 Tax=Nocardia nova SH22a TaxID=1415166 RepID=W5TEP7_9NOCA|nr:BlaI/MecI/CopY family transcriptional regulator [Nocardia nova]AHH17712.1 transcriptional regulator [Nocardia nova SH22a]